MYNPIGKNIVISRNVIFFDNEVWDGMVDDTMGISITIPIDDEEVADDSNIEGETIIEN